jgi:NAD kinase
MRFQDNIKEYLNNILVVYKHAGCSGCVRVSEMLDSLGYKHKKILRDKVTKNDFKDKKLVIIVAGDGTTLRTCQKISNDCLVFTVNNHPLITEGFLTRADVDNFTKKFNKIIKGNFKVRLLPRLEARINGELLPQIALNEISISTEKPYHTLIYDFKKNIEKASGILISTPIGSTAWLLSAGGKKLSLNSDKMAYVIREPYRGKIYKVRNRSGITNNFKVKAISKGVLVFDSVEKEHYFKSEDTIEVSFSDSPIYFVEV